MMLATWTEKGHSTGYYSTIHKTYSEGEREKGDGASCVYGVKPGRRLGISSCRALRLLSDVWQVYRR